MTPFTALILNLALMVFNLWAYNLFINREQPRLAYLHFGLSIINAVCAVVPFL